MWWTPDGQRVLQGAEGRLFREALGMAVDMIREDEENDWEFGARTFDSLQPNQKLALLAQAGGALLFATEPMPKQTAALEAAAGVVYEVVRLAVEMEIDHADLECDSPAPSWRELVLAACQEQEIEELPDAQSKDLDTWEVLVDSLADGVLWDEDWRDGEELMDADPKAGRAVKELLGIDTDYYVTLPPDPSAEEMEGIWKKLRNLTQ